MPLLSDTGEVTALTVLFRKSPTAPDPLEYRMPDGGNVVRKKALGGSQQIALYIKNASGVTPVNITDIEVYVEATQSWISLITVQIPVAADTAFRQLVETYPTESHVRITMSNDSSDHRIECASYTP